MKKLSLQEAYENGLTIVEDLGQLVSPRYEEVYEDHNTQEVIRKIARSQDDWSIWWTGTYLKNLLTANSPERQYSSQFQSTLKTVLNKFYLGEKMPIEASSTKHAILMERQAHTRALRLERALNDCQIEVKGITDPSSVTTFLDDVLHSKYAEDLTPSEYEELKKTILSGLPKQFPQIPPAEKVFEVAPQEGILLLETKLFVVTLIIMTEKGWLLKVSRRDRSQELNVFWSDGHFYPKFQADEVSNMLDDPKHLALFEQRIQEAIDKRANNLLSQEGQQKP